MPLYLNLNEMDFLTPVWVKEHVLKHGDGGWFHPLYVEAGHPLLTEKWACDRCEETLVVGEVVAPMPSGDEWVVTHMECVLRGICPPGMDRKEMRPTDYAELSPEHQSRIDARLGIVS